MLKLPSAAYALLVRILDRAVICISYSAANRVALRVDHAAGNDMSVLLISITAGCFLLLDTSTVAKNSCVQTTLSILLSKLAVHACTPMELGAGILMPATATLLLTLYSGLCTSVRWLLRTGAQQAQWDLIVPYVVIFATSLILKACTRNAQLHLLYAGAIGALITDARSQEQALSSRCPYLSLFINSLMSRGIVLMLQNYVFVTEIDKTDLPLTFAYMCLVVALFTLLKPYQHPQIEICLGVLMFSMCRRAVQTLKALCDGHLSTTFAVTTTIIGALLLYQHTRLDPSATLFCINSIGILWDSILEGWVMRFYQPGGEPFLLYLLIFVGMQALRDAVGEAPPTAETAKQKEIVLIASESAAPAVKH